MIKWVIALNYEDEKDITPLINITTDMAFNALSIDWVYKNNL